MSSLSRLSAENVHIKVNVDSLTLKDEFTMDDTMMSRQQATGTLFVALLTCFAFLGLDDAGRFHCGLLFALRIIPVDPRRVAGDQGGGEKCILLSPLKQIFAYFAQNLMLARCAYFRSFLNFVNARFFMRTFMQVGCDRRSAKL